MASVTIKMPRSGPISLQDVGVIRGITPVTCDAIFPTRLMCNKKTGTISLSDLRTSTVLVGSGVAGTAPQFVGFSYALAGSLSIPQYISDDASSSYAVVEVGYNPSNGICDIVFNGATLAPSNFVKGVLVATTAVGNTYGFFSDTTGGGIYTGTGPLGNQNRYFQWTGNFGLTNGAAFDLYVFL